LNPRDETLKLKIVRFIAESVEERARWFKALQSIAEESRGRSESMFSQRVELPRSDSPIEEHKG